MHYEAVGVVLMVVWYSTMKKFVVFGRQLGMSGTQGSVNTAISSSLIAKRPAGILLSTFRSSGQGKNCRLAVVDFSLLSDCRDWKAGMPIKCLFEHYLG